MAVKYSKTFVANNPIRHEDVTVLVEYVEAKDFQGVSVDSLDGKYYSTEDFNKEANHFFDILKKGVDAAKPYMRLAPQQEKCAKLLEGPLKSLSLWLRRFEKQALTLRNTDGHSRKCHQNTRRRTAVG